MKRKQLLIIYLILINAVVSGTAQYANIIWLNGYSHKLFSTPLFEYFKDHPEKRPTEGILSTALYRGYIADFEIINEKLYLIDLKVMKRTSDDIFSTDYAFVSVYDNYFSDKLFLGYYSGTLIIPEGKMIKYIHGGFFSIYEKYIILEIENGTLIASKSYNYIEDQEYLKEEYDFFNRLDKYITEYNIEINTEKKQEPLLDFSNYESLE